MYNVYDSPNIPDEYLCEIGRVVVNWNKLESALYHTLVIALLGHFVKDGRAIAVFAHMAFPQKLDVLSSMLRIVDTELHVIYRDKVQGLLKSAQEKRNAIVHQPWYSYDGGVIRSDVKARGTLKLETIPVSVQELRETSEFIAHAYGQLCVLVTLTLPIKADPQEDSSVSVHP